MNNITIAHYNILEKIINYNYSNINIHDDLFMTNILILRDMLKKYDILDCKIITKTYQDIPIYKKKHKKYHQTDQKLEYTIIFIIYLDRYSRAYGGYNITKSTNIKLSTSLFVSPFIYTKKDFQSYNHYKNNHDIRYKEQLPTTNQDLSKYIHDIINQDNILELSCLDYLDLNNQDNQKYLDNPDKHKNIYLKNRRLIFNYKHNTIKVNLNNHQIFNNIILDQIDNKQDVLLRKKSWLEENKKYILENIYTNENIILDNYIHNTYNTPDYLFYDHKDYHDYLQDKYTSIYLNHNIERVILIKYQALELIKSRQIRLNYSSDIYYHVIKQSYPDDINMSDETTDETIAILQSIINSTKIDYVSILIMLLRNLNNLSQVISWSNLYDKYKNRSYLYLHDLINIIIQAEYYLIIKSACYYYNQDYKNIMDTREYKNDLYINMKDHVLVNNHIHTDTYTHAYISNISRDEHDITMMNLSKLFDHILEMIKSKNNLTNDLDIILYNTSCYIEDIKDKYKILSYKNNNLLDI